MAEPLGTSDGSGVLDRVVRSRKGNSDGPAPADPVNHPQHYTSVVPGVECIEVTEHFDFLRGNAIKYLWRAGAKGDSPVEDLRKAKWYIDREIDRIEGWA